MWLLLAAFTLPIHEWMGKVQVKRNSGENACVNMHRSERAHLVEDD